MCPPGLYRVDTQVDPYEPTSNLNVEVVRKPSKAVYGVRHPQPAEGGRRVGLFFGHKNLMTITLSSPRRFEHSATQLFRIARTI